MVVPDRVALASPQTYATMNTTGDGTDPIVRARGRICHVVMVVDRSAYS